MPQQRRSKYIRPAAKDRTPYRPDRRDWDYYKLFGPEHQYGYLGMNDMALLLGRNVRATQKRVRTLWERGEVNIWYPDGGFVGAPDATAVGLQGDQPGDAQLDRLLDQPPLTISFGQRHR